MTLLDLTGAGIVTVSFEAYPNGNLAYTTATHTFSAVPEPGTWMLVVVGIAAALLLLRAKRTVC